MINSIQEKYTILMMIRANIIILDSIMDMRTNIMNMGMITLAKTIITEAAKTLTMILIILTYNQVIMTSMNMLTMTLIKTMTQRILLMINGDTGEP